EKRRCSRRIPDRRLGKARPARDPRHFISLEALWEEPSCAAFLEGLSSFSRVILMDRRGVGLSDPVTAGDPPTIEQWMDDIVAVLAAVGSGPRARAAPRLPRPRGRRCRRRVLRQHSTGPAVPSGARARFGMPSEPSVSRFGPASIPAKWSERETVCG